MLTKNEREKMVSAQLEAAVWEPVAGHRHPRAELPLVEGGHLQHPTPATPAPSNPAAATCARAQAAPRRMSTVSSP